MMELITRTARLVPYAKRPKQVPSFVTATVIEPAPESTEAILGSLFIVIEVLVSGRPGEDIADIITHTFEQTYFGPAEAEATSLDRFESAIRATNNALSDCINQGNAAWIGKLSAVVAVQAGHELHLTHTGSAEAFLYRHSANTKITAAGNARPASPTKTFGLVASGELQPDDHLLLATPALIHQMELKKLHETIQATSPNAAIAELTELLRGSDTGRIAALVIEITTPELAALQVRTDQPSDITIGAPETPLEAAKVMAAPIAQATVDTSKRAGKAAKVGWEQARPQLHRAALATAKASRAVLSGERLAKRSLLGLGVLIIVVTAVIWHSSTQHANSRLLDRYQHDYTSYTQALTLKTSAQRDALNNVNTDVSTLAKAPTAGKLNHLLASSKLNSAAPQTVGALQLLIGNALDKLDGLSTVTGATVASFDAVKGAQPTILEEVSGTFYAIDATKNTIFVVNKSTNSVKTVPYDGAKIGRITATSVTSNNDGIYLATATPAMWLYHTGTGQITAVSVGLNSWEAASSLAAYGGNLYLLSGNNVIKHAGTITGFAAATNYFAAPLTIPNPSALCVDGYVYVSGNDGIHQYYGGTSKASLAAPSGLINLHSLRATSTSQLVGTNPTTGRIGVWSDADTLAYLGQYQLSGSAKASDAVFDPATRLYYALAGDRLVSFKATK